MKKPVVAVAGGGHGGIACAALLAGKGFDVTVYERSKEGELGYDWTDIFDPKAFAAAGIPMPESSLYEKKTNMTFYSPDFRTGLTQNVPDSAAEIKMERKDLYAHIIRHAVSCGVRFCYETQVISPIVLGNRVAGIRTDKGDVYADLVIDACGIDSPVRSNLPASFGIQPHVKEFEQFYVYRAFYNRVEGVEVKDPYKVCMLAEGITGIGWIAAEEKYADLLIGRFEPFDLKEAERTAAYYRRTNPVLGTKVLRGGSFVKIPVRQPLSLMVADGYAAIGDSAYMTVPIIGSGIANSFKAAGMLADTVCADAECSFTAQTLWPYQVRFFKELGNGLAPLASVKLLLTRLEPQELDYIFAHGILTADDMTITADDTGLASMLGGITPQDAMNKVKYVLKYKSLLKKILRVGKDIAAVTLLTAAMPKKWNAVSVKKWAAQYENAFRA